MPTSSATFSFGAHCARPPSAASASRISVDGVPGIAGAEREPGVLRGERDRLVAGEQLTHRPSLNEEGPARERGPGPERPI